MSNALERVLQDQLLSDLKDYVDKMIPYSKEESPEQVLRAAWLKKLNGLQGALDAKSLGQVTYLKTVFNALRGVSAHGENMEGPTIGWPLRPYALAHARSDWHDVLGLRSPLWDVCVGPAAGSAMLAELSIYCPEQSRGC